MPRPRKAQLSWKRDRFLLFDAEEDRSGWVLPTERGLLGPSELLHPQGDFEADSVVLEIAGKRSTGHGSSTDIVEASAKAYLSAINRHRLLAEVVHP